MQAGIDRHSRAILGDSFEDDGPTEGVYEGGPSGNAPSDSSDAPGSYLHEAMSNFHTAVHAGDIKGMAAHFKAAHRIAALDHNRDDGLDKADEDGQPGVTGMDSYSGQDED